jgi:proton glutamate symport protein
VKDPFIIAFTTASSESALPRALENMQKFGVPKHIVSFVLPTGYSFNLDGTTLYLSLAAVFCAQVVNHPIPLGTQILMLLTLMLTSKGVAGVPRASLVVLSGTIATFGISPEGIGLILGVDAFMDMARTSVNVLGNCLASAVVARWEGVSYKTDLEDVEVAHSSSIEAAA